MAALRWETPRRPAVERDLGQTELDIGQRLAKLLLVEVITAGKDHWHAEVATDGGVDFRLPDRTAIHADLDDLPSEDRLVGNAVGIAGARVIAEEEDSIGVLDTLDHTQVFVESLDEIGARIEPLDEDISHRPVAVVHDNVGCAASEGSVNRSVDIISHHLAQELVVRLAKEQFVGAGDARDTFGIGRNQDAHHCSCPLSFHTGAGLALSLSVVATLSPQEQAGGDAKSRS
jgi:hypothetical protein